MSHRGYGELASMEHVPYGADGALDRMLRPLQKPKCVPAIFVHAGAGFHSRQNENVHLQACVAAAEMGMKFLKAGSSATEAVEAALRILEDKEITNAGYGSNLSIDGTVECDATIVDYLGRSGACGAVPNIRNPISLAKLVLDRSNEPLSLRRVPPNALVGEGAKAFAEENGLSTYENEYMVSKNARDRFLRWQDDLRRADAKLKEDVPEHSPTHSNLGCLPCQYDTATPPEPSRTFPRDHTAAVMAGTWNEGQPDSPYVGTPNSESSNVSDSPAGAGYFRVLGTAAPTAGRPPLRASPEKVSASSAGVVNVQKLLPHLRAKQSSKRTEALKPESLKDKKQASQETLAKTDSHEKYHAHRSTRDGSSSPHLQAHGHIAPGDAAPLQTPPGPLRSKRPLNTGQEEGFDIEAKKGRYHTEFAEDHITDTIGAIAIDNKGQIAAGSSSGGIGMKHRGRLGPAALVGIGTAVVPRDENDEDQVSVAAVTSGTGEHMATTMASQRCAERIYYGTRRGRAGIDIKDDDEDAIMESFIAEDFMNHPGVKTCHSVGAIGAMVVKKCRTGYYFYFAHNTDSFALASMGGSEKHARCTMSRLPKGAKIAKGGRKIRIK